MPFKRLMLNFMHMTNVRQENPVLHGMAMADTIISLDGIQTAIEFKPDLVTMREVYYLARDLKGRGPGISGFLIVTPTPPTIDRLNDFRSLCEAVIGCQAGKAGDSVIVPGAEGGEASEPARDLCLNWMGLREFLDWLGYEESFDPFDVATRTRLQVGAMAVPVMDALACLEGTERRIISTREEMRRWKFQPAMEACKEFVSSTRGSLIGVRRHVSSLDVARILQRGEQNLENSFHLGKEVQNVFVVLSDFKNSSALAKATRPDVLNVVMFEYYQKVRDLTWRFGGYHDKFMGDGAAVLFNYPFARKDAAIRTVFYARCLISLGSALLDVIGDEINEEIETGTRVGIGNGALRVLDIGFTEMEPSFVGDVYNYAARLESRAKVDGLLLDHRTRTRLMEYGVDILDRLQLQPRLLSPQDAKGQNHNTKCWEITPEHLQSLPFSLLDEVRKASGDTATAELPGEINGQNPDTLAGTGRGDGAIGLAWGLELEQVAGQNGLGQGDANAPDEQPNGS